MDKADIGIEAVSVSFSFKFPFHSFQLTMAFLTAALAPPLDVHECQFASWSNISIDSLKIFAYFQSLSLSVMDRTATGGSVVEENM